MKYLLSVLFGLILISSSDGDITTVYKFNTFIADGESVKYLNTCTAASLQENDQGLPLFNITADTPLPESTIPPLYDGHNATRWELMMNNGSTVPILVPDYANITSDYSELLSQSDSSYGIIDNNYRVLSDTFENIDYSQRTIFSGSEIRITDTLLQIKYKIGFTVTIRLNYEDRDFVEITLKNSGIEVCFHRYSYSYYDGKKECDSNPGYTGDKDNNFNIFITLSSYRKISIYDHVAGIIHNTNVVLSGILQSIVQYSVQRGLNNDDPYVSYKIIQPAPFTIVSPWLDLKTNTSLVILYSRRTGSKVRVNRVYVEEATTNNTLELVYQESVLKETSYGLERVMAKVDVTIPENWTNQKRINIQSEHNFVISISNIWEGRYLDLYKIKMAKSCEKSKLNEIYKTLNGDNMLHISSCFNGGSSNMDYSSCLCPPGFAGKQCEIACGENRFGHKCSKMCSTSSNECKGMVLCTSYYGCSCATGYQGEQCLEHCPEGYYGADCKEKCGQCADGCDQYTGACRGKTPGGK